MQSLFEIALMIIDIARWIILAHIIMSWLIQFQVLNIRQAFVGQIWRGLDGLLEPVYARVRAFLPNISGIDLAPLIVLLAVFGLRIILVNNANLFF